MALPLAAGALAAAAAGRRPAARIARDIASLASVMDARGMWITVSAAALLLALIASSSRAALAGCAGALVMWIALMRSRIGRRGRWLGWTAAAVLVAFLLTFASLQRVVSRADETLGSGAGSRPQIWRDTLDVMTAFPIAGAGLGAFQTAMLAFQSSDRQTFTNQAHNQYLQVAAEGGLLVAIPALVVIALFARLAAARLAADASHLVWIRIGAIAGLTAVAVQSLWETGLRMPANGVLFAVVAAIALHRPGTVHATTPLPDPPSS
jgi:O-antigen ligase